MKIFNLVESIKADLADVIPNVPFYKMDKSFLTHFVVAKGIISADQASHVFDTLVEITNNGDVVSGAFKDDDIGILRSFKKKKSRQSTRQSTKKIRFLSLKFPIPSTPSTVTKMAGVEWYLCLAKDQVLTFKHHSMVERSDYLLTEMRSDTEFQLTPNATTFITGRINNI
uniref:Uncharacterized protein n=1 Tax=Panagrolaimus superbus TaxID=310955 RepID=A0A914Y3D3_9BILA